MEDWNSSSGRLAWILIAHERTPLRSLVSGSHGRVTYDCQQGLAQVRITGTIASSTAVGLEMERTHLIASKLAGL